MDRISALNHILDLMIQEDEKITFRRVAERSEGLFPHASSLTRNDNLRGIVDGAISRQADARAVATKYSKSSPARAAAKIAALEAEIKELKGKVELLTASHRAAILAIGRIGGMKAWREHFPAYSEAVNRLVEMEALPQAEVKSLNPHKVDA